MDILITSLPLPPSARQAELIKLTRFCPCCLRTCTGPHPEPDASKEPESWMIAPA